jgi:hypothetical protein
MGRVASAIVASENLSLKRLKFVRANLIWSSTALLFLGWIGAWPTGLLFGLIELQTYDHNRLLLFLMATTVLFSFLFVLAMRIFRLEHRATGIAASIKNEIKAQESIGNLQLRLETLPEDLKQGELNSLLGKVQAENPDLLKNFSREELRRLKQESSSTNRLVRVFINLYEKITDALPSVYGVFAIAIASFEMFT